MANSILSNSSRSDNNMRSQFQQFRNSFRGNPKQEVMRMLEAGQLSEQQLNQLMQQAQQLRNRVLNF